LVSIGKVVKTQGKRGELKLKLYSDYSLNPFFPKVFFRKKGDVEQYEVESLRPYKDHYIIKLKAVDTIDQAHRLAGLEVLVQEELLCPLEKDNYYLFQIIGCSVFTKDRKKVGTVTDFLSVESNDLLVVTRGKNDILIPLTKSICLEFNLAKKEILIDPPDGLLELNEI